MKHIRIIKSGWMYIFLGAVLLATISGLIAYQYLRQEPVKVTFKNAQGYVTAQVVFKHPNDTVGEVIQRASFESNDYECNLSLEEPINSISSLELVEKINGTINVDGATIAYTSGARTVADVLNENNVDVSPADIVTPELNKELTTNTNNITIKRGTNLVETKTEIIPFQSTVVQNDNASYNSSVVRQKGINGVRTYTQENIYSNGQLIESVITSEERVEPINEIIEIGTNIEVGKPEIRKGDIEAWRPYVIKALERNGLSTSEAMVNKVLRQINTESAGDQNAHQEIVDMNTSNGQDAKGLMQTIPYTFEHYHLEGFDDIYNGYHNLLAALNYAKQMYGENLPGLGDGHGY